MTTKLPLTHSDRLLLAAKAAKALAKLSENDARNVLHTLSGHPTLADGLYEVLDVTRDLSHSEREAVLNMATAHVGGVTP